MSTDTNSTSTDSTNTNTDVDFLNELADGQPTEVGPDTEVKSDSDATNGNTEAKEDKPKYPLIVETREEGADTSDLLTPTQFAAKLTVRNVLAEAQKTENQNLEDPGLTVPVTNIYTAMKATRHPFPVVLVGETAYLQKFDVSAKAWDERPTRGEGSSATSGGKLDDEDLKRLAWKSYEDQETLYKRRNRLNERISKSEKLYAMRKRQLGERQIAWETVEKWAEENTEEEIPDNDEKDNS